MSNFQSWLSQYDTASVGTTYDLKDQWQIDMDAAQARLDNWDWGANYDPTDQDPDSTRRTRPPQEYYKEVNRLRAIRPPGLDEGYYQDLGGLSTNVHGFMMNQTLPGGVLADTAQSNAARQMSAQHAQATRLQQDQMGQMFAASGVNPLLAQQRMAQAEQTGREQLGYGMAGLEQQLDQRRAQAGSSMIGFDAAVMAEMTSRKEEQARWQSEYMLAQEHKQAMAAAASGGGGLDFLKLLAVGIGAWAGGPVGGAAASEVVS